MNKNGVVSNVIWKFAERILAQAVSLAVSIVLARILDPEHFGAIAMVMVFITIANVFVTEGIPVALIQKKDSDELDFSSVFWLNMGLSVVLYLAIFFTSGLIAGFYEEPQLDLVLKIIGIKLIIAGVNSVQHSYVSKHMMFRKYFWSTLFGTVLSGVVGIIMAYKGCGIWALVAQYLINSTVDMIILFITVRWYPKFKFSFKRIGRLFKFGWKILVEGLSNVLFGQLNNLIIGKVYDADDLAYYTKGQQFPNLIVTNITTAIGSVLLPAMSNEQDDHQRVLTLLRKSISLSSYVVFPMLFGLAAVAGPLISVLLGDKWMAVEPFLIFFSLSSIATVCLIPRHQAINSIGRSDVFMYEHMGARVIALVTLILVYKISVLAIALGGLVSIVVLLVTVFITSKKFNGYRFRDQLIDILPTLIGCIIMFVPVFFMKYIPLPNWAILIMQIFVGITIYLLFSIITKNKNWLICKDYARAIIKRKKTVKDSIDNNTQVQEASEEETSDKKDNINGGNQ